MFKGATHIHSTYSDGEFTLSEIRDIYVVSGCSFVCMTDHAEYFDESRLEAYVRECRSLSDERFALIAGLEFTCDRRMHVLGLGATSLTSATDPQQVFGHIRDAGGVSVIAHPMDSAFDWIETFDELPTGIEVWNTKYDGRYAPRAQTFGLLNRLQARSDLRAFYGTDLHWRTQYRGLFQSVGCTTLNRDQVLAAFSRGDYFAIKSDLKLPSNGRLSTELLSRFESEHANSDRLRKMAKRAKVLTSSLGLNVPAALKAQLRRVF
jgi:hypothetical protein